MVFLALTNFDIYVYISLTQDSDLVSKAMNKLLAIPEDQSSTLVDMACLQTKRSDIRRVYIWSNEEEISCNGITQGRFGSEIGNIKVFPETRTRRNCTVEVG